MEQELEQDTTFYNAVFIYLVVYSFHQIIISSQAGCGSSQVL